jgi:hypothetical protein
MQHRGAEVHSFAAYGSQEPEGQNPGAKNQKTGMETEAKLK